MSRKKIIAEIILLASLIGLVVGIRVFRGSPPAIEMEPYKIKGANNATTFIVVFSDFECPYCNKIRPVLDDVLKTFPNDLKLVFKHFPLSIHPSAEPAAEASECAADQGKFWEYNDYLFDHVGDWYKAKDLTQKFTGYAGKLGLEMITFRSCLESGVKKAIVEKNKTEGRHVFVQGTPTCLLNGRKVLTSHKPEDIKALVRRELEKGKGK